MAVILVDLVGICVNDHRRNVSGGYILKLVLTFIPGSRPRVGRRQNITLVFNDI